MAHNQDNLRSIGTLPPEERKRIASNGGKKRAIKHRERKAVAEALRMILDEPMTKGSRNTKLDGIAMKVVKKMFDNPDVRDLKVLAEILGELKQTINAEGLTLTINASEEGKENISRLIEGE